MGAKLLQNCPLIAIWRLLGASWPSPGANLGQLGAFLGPTWRHFGPNLAQLSPTWRQLGPNLASTCPKFDQKGTQEGEHKEKHENHKIIEKPLVSFKIFMVFQGPELQKSTQNRAQTPSEAHF